MRALDLFLHATAAAAAIVAVITLLERNMVTGNFPERISERQRFADGC